MTQATDSNAISSRISLSQWQCLVAVVDRGGYAQAAEALHLSQSSVTYAVQKIQSLLGVRAFEIRGRKAVLTPTGELLYRRARGLLEDANSLERAARKASAGWESELSLAAEILFPTWMMFEALDQFGREAPQTQIEWYETVIGGTHEALERGQADLAISPQIPAGYTGEPLLPIRFIPVAHRDHPLFALGREVTLRDLRKHRHLVVRDSSSTRDKRPTSLDAPQRWTMSNMATSIGAACRGHGFAWFPTDKIRGELQSGLLKPLPLRGGRERTAQLYLVFADLDAAGPATRRLAQVLREVVARTCAFAAGADMMAPSNGA